MKPALFYAIRDNLYSSTRIIAVTSIKRDRYWFGREISGNMASHGKLRDLRGKFESAEAAQNLVDTIFAIKVKHQQTIDAASTAHIAAIQNCRNEIESVLPSKSPLAILVRS